MQLPYHDNKCVNEHECNKSVHYPISPAALDIYPSKQNTRSHWVLVEGMKKVEVSHIVFFNPVHCPDINTTLCKQ